jgi:hypothetical protein
MRLDVFTYSAAWMSENHNQPILQTEVCLYLSSPISILQYAYETILL